MADAPAPTEEQITAANEAQQAHWQGDFKEEDLVIPYKREAEDEKPDEEEAPEAPVVDEVAEEYSEPEPVVTAQDPGAYVPADYSFEITIGGKTYTVDSPEKAEELGEAHAEEMSAKEIFALINKGSKIELKQERDKEKWEADKKKFDEQVAVESQRMEVVGSIEKEFNYLVGKGKLPDIAAEFKDADWSKPEVAKQAGVKEQLALLAYMNKENTIRAKAGIKPFGPIDALTAMQNDSAEQAKVAEAKAAGEARKAASSRVAGVAPSPSGIVAPKGIAVGRTGVFDRGAAVWDN